MNKNKIIGLSVALIGAISVGITSYALYENVQKGGDINVDVFVPTELEGVISYTAGEPAIKEGTNKVLGPKSENRSITYTVAIGGNYAPTLPQQKYVPGNLNVALTGALAKDLTMSVVVTGYAETEDQNGNFGGHKYGGAASYIINESNVMNRDITVNTLGNILEVTLTLKENVNEETFLDYADKGFNIGVTWGKPSQTFIDNAAYVVGDASGWDKRLDYMMVEDLEAIVDKNTGEGVNAKTIWTYTGLKGFTQAKVRQQVGEADVWAGKGNGNNIALDPNHTYTFGYTTDKANSVTTTDNGVA